MSLFTGQGTKTSRSIVIKTANAGTTGVSGFLMFSSGTTSSGSSGELRVGTGTSSKGKGGSISISVGDGASEDGGVVTVIAGKTTGTSATTQQATPRATVVMCLSLEGDHSR